MNQIKHLCHWMKKGENTIRFKQPLFRVSTIDNPGWSFKIALIDTELDGIKMDNIQVNRTEEDWVVADIREGEFFSVGGALNLKELIDIFLNIAYHEKTPKTFEESPDLSWLVNWYHSNCDDDWEHSFRIRINAITAFEWEVQIGITEMDLEDKHFEKMLMNKGSENWIECYVEKHKFIGKCSINNLESVLKIFRNWVES